MKGKTMRNPAMLLPDKELIKVLRKCAKTKGLVNIKDTGLDKTIIEAAARLEALSEDNARLLEATQ